MIDELVVLLEDESQPVPRRLMHAVTHLVREQARIADQEMEKLMTIQDTINELAAKVAADVDTIRSEIAALKDANPTVDTSALEAAVGGLDSLAAENAPAPEPEPAPPVDQPAPEPTNPDGSPIAAPPANTAQFQPLYVVDGDVNGDPSNWTPFPNYVTLSGQPLFTFSGDAPSPGAVSTGDGLGGEWHLYTGDLAATS